jgi:hypothetical protein
MSITINGSGTVTGISAGGLPDDCITTADIAANAVTTAKLGSNEASGLCKAWVNFNGTGTVAIRASYNVSSITDNGTGDFTVNFTTALADANYSVSVAAGGTGGTISCVLRDDAAPRTTALCRVSPVTTTFGAFDAAQVNVSIFR